MDLVRFYARNSQEEVGLLGQHTYRVAISTVIAVLGGVPLGIMLTRRPAWRGPVLGLANVFQTIPSLALFGFLIPLPFIGGIGATTAIVALVVYALLPIVRNTYVGIAGVDPAVREAGRGMGMTDWQLLTQVELPLGLGVILAGGRISPVGGVGTATIATGVGGGGLGVYIFRGVATVDNTLILAGALPAALMAIAADGLLGLAERRLAWGRGSQGRRGVGGPERGRPSCSIRHSSSCYPRAANGTIVSSSGPRISRSPIYSAKSSRSRSSGGRRSLWSGAFIWVARSSVIRRSPPDRSTCTWSTRARRTPPC